MNILSLSLVFSVLCLLMACENDPAEVAALFPTERPDAEIVTDFTTIYSDSAQVKVRITGPLMLRYQEGAQDFIQLFPEGVFVEFFDEFGEVNSTLQSKYGIRYEDQEKVVVRDSVIWQAVAGDRLDTDELIWEGGKDRIYSDLFVRLRQGDKEITGVGFESNEDFSRSSVRAIQGVVTMEE